MQTFDAQRLAALDTAIRHDQLVIQQEAIHDKAREKAPDLHKKASPEDQQSWFDQLLHDAAEWRYDAESLSLVYNCVLWAEGPFYREPPYDQLFQYGLLHPQTRDIQMYRLLWLNKHQLLSDHPWYAGLDTDPLAERVPRIHQERERYTGYQQQDTPSAQYQMHCLVMEYQALLLALLRQVLGSRAARWQPGINENEDLVDIENTTLKRRLSLRIGLGAPIQVTGTQDEQGQHLMLALPDTLTEDSIAAFMHYLSAYLLEQENAPQIQEQITRAMQQANNPENLDAQGE